METLENVKEGDKVIFSNSWTSSVEVVTKVTKTQIHTKFSKYRKSDGRRIGAGSWDSDKILPYNQELVNRINRNEKQRKMVNELKNYPYHKLSYDNLEKIYNFLKEDKQ